MSIESVQLELLRLSGHGSALLSQYWYLVLPAVLTLASIALLRAGLRPAPGMRRWRGLLVDVSEQHDLVVLVHAARQDRVFRQEVLRLLRMPARARRALLEETLRGMRARGEPESLIEAFGLLRDDHVVAETERLLLLEES